MVSKYTQLPKAETWGVILDSSIYLLQQQTHLHLLLI